jgi:hypothetical protein
MSTDKKSQAMAKLGIAVSIDGTRIKSDGEATKRMAFAAWTLVKMGDEPRPQGIDPEAEEFYRAAAALLEAAGHYHAALEARMTVK